jgi:hypothetical protein
MEIDESKSWAGLGACKLCVGAKRSIHVMKLVMSAPKSVRLQGLPQSAETNSELPHLSTLLHLKSHAHVEFGFLISTGTTCGRCHPLSSVGHRYCENELKTSCNTHQQEKQDQSIDWTALGTIFTYLVLRCEFKTLRHTVIQ